MKVWQCIFCSKDLRIPSRLESHLRVHTRERPFTCPICRKSYSEKGILMTHINTHKKTGRPYKCKQCPLAFTLVNHLKNHLISVHNVLKLPKEECPTCGKVFTKGNKMRGHQLRVHTQLEKQHQCIICEKWFINTQQLMRHMRIHTGEKPFPCQKCPLSFSQGSQRKAHLIRKHDVGVRITCPVCNKSASTKSDLEMHMRVHTNERPFPCSMCSIACTNSANLKSHMRVHSAEKPFCCNVCGKRYSSSAAYKAHCQNHTGNNGRSYKCEECPLSFYTKPKLKWHIKFVHRNERPYPCNICGRAFQTPNNRDRHINTHLRENPYQYQCEICGKRFNYLASLTRHTKQEHSKAASECYPCSKCPLILKSELHFSRHYLLDHVGSKDNLFQCIFCKFHGKDLRKLECHYTKHTGEQPYFCSKCPKSFGSSGNLSVHYHSFHSLNIERSKVYRFQCSKCPYILKSELELSRHYLLDHVGSNADFLKCLFCSFRAISSLRDLEYHYAKHTGERPYFCSKCPLSFVTSGNLRKHLKIVHNITTIETL